MECSTAATIANSQSSIARSPTPDGGMETKAFDTFTGIGADGAQGFPVPRNAEPAGIAPIMQRASKAEAAQLEDMNENR